MRSVLVIGGGPAGMMAACAAAARGASAVLIEKNEKLGKKLYITGKGRCNLTNAADADGLLSRVNTNARFLYSAFSALGSAATMEFFESNNVPLVVERGRRVFPASGHASDITSALEYYMKKHKARVILNRKALSIETDGGGRVSGVKTDGGFISADAVIVATGGLSYPSTGSTGDGYGFAEALGHSVTPRFPSLVPLTVSEAWARELTGLSLKNIRVSVHEPGKKKPLYAETGEMLFTHTGVSGPVILSASRFIADKPGKGIKIFIDLKPALAFEKLDARVTRDFHENINRHFSNAVEGLLPQRLIETVVALSGIPPSRKTNEITREERLKFTGLLKGLAITPVATAGYNEAVITAGGVDVREINPSTLMSKKINGLYFAGEVLDVDAMTGGYNLQIAFSTGYLAGISAAEGEAYG